MANTQVATQQRQPSPVAVMQRAVADRQDELKKALPGHISVEKFVRTAQTAIVSTRNIEKANPQSLLMACSKAAADGLILDGREAALVIDYKGEVQYRPMMRGLLKLAYNSGLVKSISVQVAHENDEFEYFLGDEERIEHKIDFKSGDRGAPMAVYAVAHLADGVVMREVMTVAQINAIRDRSDAWKAYKADKIKSTPWSTDWTEMARKTVFRRLSKWLPSSTDRDALHSAAERLDEDYTFDEQVADEPEITQTATKKRGGAAAALARTEPEVIDQPEHDEDGVVSEPDMPPAPPVEAYEQQPGDDI
jgi:recombination protein RecT